MSEAITDDGVSKVVELANALRATMEHATHLANQLAALGWKCEAQLKPDPTRITAYEHLTRISREQWI